MTRALKGLNRRTVDTSPGECYLTPRWAVEWLLVRWTPLGQVICDPCACGFGGWAIGKEVGDHLKRRVELFDIDPKHEDVVELDFRDLQFDPTNSRTIVTNPPYDLLPEFVRWGLEQAEEVVVLTRFGFLCAEDGARAKNLWAYLQPAKRLAFELLPEEGKRRIAHNKHLVDMVFKGECSDAAAKKQMLDVHADPRTLTGYRMSATGVDHGWAIYRRGWTGDARIVIESANDDKQGRLP